MTENPLEPVLFGVKRRIVGEDVLLARMVIAMLAGGRLLVDGVPGLAGTLAVTFRVAKPRIRSRVEITWRPSAAFGCFSIGFGLTTPSHVTVAKEHVDIAFWFAGVGRLIITAAVGLSLWWNRVRTGRAPRVSWGLSHEAFNEHAPE